MSKQRCLSTWFQRNDVIAQRNQKQKSATNAVPKARIWTTTHFWARSFAMDLILLVPWPDHSKKSPTLHRTQFIVVSTIFVLICFLFIFLFSFSSEGPPVVPFFGPLRLWGAGTACGGSVGDGADGGQGCGARLMHGALPSRFGDPGRGGGGFPGWAFAKFRRPALGIGRPL